MRILYLTKTFPIRESVIADKLKDKYSEVESVYACTFSQRNYLDLIEWRNQKHTFDGIFNFVEFNKKHKKVDVLSLDEELIKYETKYNIDLNLALSADRYVIKFHRNKIKVTAYKLIDFFEKAINENKINVVIGEISSFSDYICYKICERNHIPFVFFWHGRIKDRIEFVNLYGERYRLDKLYKELSEKPFTNEDNEMFDNYMEEMKKSLTPDYMKFSKQNSLKTVWKKNNKQSKFLRLKKYLKSYIWDMQYSVDMPPQITYKISKLIRKLLFPLKRIIANKYFQHADLEKDKYVLVPLHYQPEASTMTYAPFYLDQINYIKNLSKAIPGGYYLYVKEHPAMVLDRKTTFYKELKNIHNVKIIGDNHSVVELLNFCQGVVTLTNTTGYEAILLDKPVFVFGNVFYKKYKYTYNCKNYYDFMNCFKHAISNWDKGRKERQDNRKAFILACLKSLYKGNLNSILYDSTYFEDSNIELLCDNIMSYIRSKLYEDND